MAGRSRRQINLGTVALIVMVHLAPVCARAWDVREGAVPKNISARMVNALGREIAFVRSFSVSYPYQFKRQNKEDRKKMNDVTVEDIGAQKK